MFNRDVHMYGNGLDFGEDATQSTNPIETKGRLRSVFSDTLGRRVSLAAAMIEYTDGNRQTRRLLLESLTGLMRRRVAITW